MPTTLEATKMFLRDNGVLFCPGKAANAGGVATSAPRDVARTPQRLSWTFEEVDAKLQEHHEEHLRTSPTTRPRSTATRATSLWARTSPASSRSPTP